MGILHFRHWHTRTRLVHGTRNSPLGREARSFLSWGLSACTPSPPGTEASGGWVVGGGWAVGASGVRWFPSVPRAPHAVPWSLSHPGRWSRPGGYGPHGRSSWRGLGAWADTGPGSPRCWCGRERARLRQGWRRVGQGCPPLCIHGAPPPLTSQLHWASRHRLWHSGSQLAWGLLWEGRVGAFGVGLSLRMCVLLGVVTGILSCTLGRLKSKEPWGHVCGGAPGHVWRVCERLRRLQICVGDPRCHEVETITSTFQEKMIHATPAGTRQNVTQPEGGAIGK